MARTGDREWQRIAIYNHDTNLFGRIGGKLRPRRWANLRSPVIGFVIGIICAALLATHAPQRPPDIAQSIRDLSLIFGIPAALIALWGSWLNARARMEKRIDQVTRRVADCLHHGADLHALEMAFDGSRQGAPRTQPV